jgi:hypothetical protein
MAPYAPKEGKEKLEKTERERSKQIAGFSKEIMVGNELERYSRKHQLGWKMFTGVNITRDKMEALKEVSSRYKNLIN